jgi:antitoxin (DNA-binding transcriptional repressor) of toxin-antitoxin stability system
MYAMADVNVTELRQKLPSYLERARRGERIRVFARGAAIAEITAPKATEMEARLIRERLQGALTQYDVPTEPAFASEDWSVNR